MSMKFSSVRSHCYAPSLFTVYGKYLGKQFAELLILIAQLAHHLSLANASISRTADA